MLERFWQRRKDNEEGFTLIELMVVVLIIGILIAIALPTFLGARERAQNRAAQSDLRNGLVTAKGFFTDNETYAGFNTAAGELAEPSLDWAGPADPAVGQITITVAGVGSAATVLLQTESASGDGYCVLDTPSVGTTYGANTTGAAIAAAACNLASW